jgi:hypothetical protein
VRTPLLAAVFFLVVARGVVFFLVFEFEFEFVIGIFVGFFAAALDKLAWFIYYTFRN